MVIEHSFMNKSYTAKIYIYIYIYIYQCHSVLQCISRLKYWPHPFLPRPLPKNSETVSPHTPSPLDEQPPSNFWRLDSPPGYVPLSKKVKTHFLKKQKILFPTMK